MLGLVIANRLCVEVFVLGWYIYAKMSEKFRAVVGVRWVKSLWAERVISQCVKQTVCAVGELCGKDSWARRRECQATSGDGRLPYCCARSWFNEGQK